MKLPKHIEAPFARACAWDRMLAAFDLLHREVYSAGQTDTAAWRAVRGEVLIARLDAWSKVAAALVRPDETQAGGQTLRDMHEALIRQAGGEALAAADAALGRDGGAA